MFIHFVFIVSYFVINWNQMIEMNEIFSDSDTRIALWCNSAEDTNDLAVLADNIIENKISLISAPAGVVSFLWTCLEKSKVKILTRYFFEPINKNIDKDVSVLAENIVSVCKCGASGIQIFVKMRDFYGFMDILSVIRDDLFFGHDLCIMMDISDIDINNWDMIFEKLRDVRADVFGISMNEDMGNRSDFIGRIYGMLQKWNFGGDLHFVLNDNLERIDQAIRLVESLRPELSEKLRFFIEY